MTSLRTLHRRRPSQSGIVLPIALIMLVIISFAGLLAARRSANFEMFSNNMRTNQVARVAAEEALRQCERVAKAKYEESGLFPTAVGKILLDASDTIASDEDIGNGEWNTKTNWKKNGANLIAAEIAPSFGSDVKSEAQNVTVHSDDEVYQRSCIIQEMGVAGDRYLITARGLSSDAVIDDGTGALTSGSEVWLQSILTPAVPELDDAGGVK